MGKNGQSRGLPLRLCSTWTDAAQADGIALLCPFLAGLDPATGFWLGALGWHDANGGLLAALGPPLREGAQVFAGVYAADPFRRMDDILAALKAHGVAGMINLPSVSMLDGSFGHTLESLRFGADREMQMLGAARAADLRVAACVRDQEMAAAALAQGADLLVVHAGPPSPERQCPAALTRDIIRTARRRVAVVAADDLINDAARLCRGSRPRPRATS